MSYHVSIRFPSFEVFSMAGVLVVDAWSTVHGVRW